MHRTYFVLAAAVAGGCLVAAGCGGSKSAPAALSTTTPTTATTATTSTTTTAAPAATTTTASGGRTLEGTVGPGFTIALTQGGKAVTALTAGTYTLRVDDEANIHDFHLRGPGVNVATTVPFVGKKSFTITLKAGKYHYQCDPHASAMNGDFTVS